MPLGGVKSCSSVKVCFEVTPERVEYCQSLKLSLTNDPSPLAPFVVD